MSGLVDFSIGDLGHLATNIREAITGEAIKDPQKMAEIALQAEQLEQALKQGQIEINKAEAASTNWFVAGWRPFIGWVGGVALAYQFVIQPFIIWGVELAGKQITPPTLDTVMLFNLVLAMLGLGGMRMFEKVKRVQDKH